MKYSVNAKRNAVLQGIEDCLLSMEDTREICINEIRRYVRTFPSEPDFNLAQYGRCLVSSYQVKEAYKAAGYKSVDTISDEKIWQSYLHDVGYVAKQLLNNE